MISIIAALTPKRVLGKDNKLIWHLREDLKNFKRLTSGNTIIMGRKTFDSIGKPLPNRHNIVISASLPPTAGLDVCRTLSEAMQKANQYDKETFIIGGASIYEQALPLADKMYLSHLKQEYDGDVFFPEFNPAAWHVEEQQEFPEFTFKTYRRKA